MAHWRIAASIATGAATCLSMVDAAHALPPEACVAVNARTDLPPRLRTHIWIDASTSFLGGDDDGVLRAKRLDQLREVLSGIASRPEIEVTAYRAFLRVGSETLFPTLPTSNWAGPLESGELVQGRTIPFSRRDTPLVAALRQAERSLRGSETAVRPEIVIVVTDAVQSPREGEAGCHALVLPKPDAPSMTTPSGGTFSRLALVALPALRGECLAKTRLPDLPTLDMREPADRRDPTGVRPPTSAVDDFRQELIAQDEATPPATPIPDPTYEPFDDVVRVAGRSACSGLLVDRRHVLTARHCLPARIVLGASRGVPWHRKVVASVPHQTLDVAVLRTEAPAPRDVELHSLRSARDRHGPEGEVLLVGFGLSVDRSRARQRTVSIPASGWGCDRARAAECADGAEMVLRGPPGADSCNGDSGAPVFEAAVVGASGRANACEHRAIAITSRRTADAKAFCGAGGIYTRIDVIAPWIERVRREGGDP